MRQAALKLTALACLLAACGSQAAPLTLGVLGRADDPRLDPKRVELAYLGQPGGVLTDAVDVAVKESKFELEEAKLEVKVEASDVKDANEAKAALLKLEKAGAQAALVDWPAAWISAAVPAVKLPVFNVGAADDALRQAACLPNLFHTLPSERMRSDALAQTLVARRWSKVLVLQGSSPEDATRGATVQASLKRYSLKVVGIKPFKLSADPRERDLANPALLTGNIDYDVVWVVDSDGEFARSLPYRTALPRPVIGDAGLTALAWAPNFERFGAPQLARRFSRAAKRPMTAQDWAAWAATKAVLQTAQLSKPATAAGVIKGLTAPDFVLDGFKGTRTSLRAWDRQLRQPMLLSDGLGVIGISPGEGVMHPKNALDTLGADEPEKLCKPK
jgi:ABC transporter substrate binding protein (PQQ-dependent alcohol dehydrogenase system)